MTTLVNNGKIYNIGNKHALAYHCPDLDVTIDREIDDTVFSAFRELSEGGQADMTEELYNVLVQLKCKILIDAYHAKVTDLIAHNVEAFYCGGGDYSPLEGLFDDFTCKLIVTNAYFRKKTDCAILGKRQSEPVSYFYITFCQRISQDIRGDFSKITVAKGWKYWSQHEDVLRDYWTNYVDLNEDDDYVKPSYEDVMKMLE